MARAMVYGFPNRWSLAPFPGAAADGTQCVVALEIQGDTRNGFHLVQEPAGFFAADSWHETQQEAMQAAEELFGVNVSQWSNVATIRESN